MVHRRAGIDRPAQGILHRSGQKANHDRVQARKVIDGLGEIGREYMDRRQSTKEQIRQFLRSDQRVLILPFEGLRCDVSKHWHRFLEMSTWELLHKSLVLAVTRYMYSGPVKNALLRSIGITIGKNVFI